MNNTVKPKRRKLNNRPVNNLYESINKRGYKVFGTNRLNNLITHDYLLRSFLRDGSSRKQLLSTQTNFSDRQLRKRDFIQRDLTAYGAIHHAFILGKTKQYAKQYMEKYNNFGVESSTIDYPVTLIAPTEELEELTVEESSSDEDDFDAMEVEPMLTHINKRARFE